MDQSKEKIKKEFSSLRKISDVQEFLLSLNAEDPFESALGYYIKSWPLSAAVGSSFDPYQFIAEDFSAAYLGQCPVIFEGTNCWAEKGWYPHAYFEMKLNELLSHCVRFRAEFPTQKICLVVVPEKDFVLSWALLHETRFAAVVEAMSRLRSRLKDLSIPLVFEQSVSGIGPYFSLDEFSYPDSHLHPRNYIIIFSHVLQALGFSWPDVSPHVKLRQATAYGDLSGRFAGDSADPYSLSQIDMQVGNVTQAHGSLSFESPLGNTSQLFENSLPLIDESVLILGDSHSSILAEHRLTYLAANTFRETKFHWNPAGVRSDVPPGDYSTIFLEISLRFIF